MGGALALNHGMYELWCEKCTLTEQLNYAYKIQSNIPELEKRLEELKVG